LIHLLVRSSITESELIAMPLEAVISTSGLFNVLVSHGQPLPLGKAVAIAYKLQRGFYRVVAPKEPR
jgi:hypothetical protein